MEAALGVDVDHTPAHHLSRFILVVRKGDWAARDVYKRQGDILIDGSERPQLGVAGHQPLVHLPVIAGPSHSVHAYKELAVLLGDILFVRRVEEVARVDQQHIFQEGTVILLVLALQLPPLLGGAVEHCLLYTSRCV